VGLVFLFLVLLFLRSIRSTYGVGWLLLGMAAWRNRGVVVSGWPLREGAEPCEVPNGDSRMGVATHVTGERAR